ncbi:hypothetical protein [Natrinema sp. 74]|uniref:hypothetical protein n=1 Tax=Natrinema sp. 74 TaxID=3384159 RepID=UPI0038D513E3
MLEALAPDERVNAAVGWLLTGVVALDGVKNAVGALPLWGGFELIIVAVTAGPALVTRDWTAMVPWPLLSVAAVAVIAGAGGVSFETVAYLAVATLALVIVVELEAFSSVDLSRRFAVFFGVLLTMALQALWTVVQFYSDRWLGTEYLRTQTELQWDFVIVTAVGLALGVLFRWYFSRFELAGTVSHRTTNGSGSA